jgi:hypothetical protein
MRLSPVFVVIYTNGYPIFWNLMSLQRELAKCGERVFVKKLFVFMWRRFEEDYFLASSIYLLTVLRSRFIRRDTSS